MNPILTFIENMKLIEREKETRKLDEHAKYMLAMEAMKLEVESDSLRKNVGSIVEVLNMPLYDVFKEPLNSIASSLYEVSSSLDYSSYQENIQIDESLFGQEFWYNKHLYKEKEVDSKIYFHEVIDYKGKLIGVMGKNAILKDKDTISFVPFSKLNTTEDVYV